MSLPSLARDDARAILAADGDSVTLTAPESLGGAVYASVPCLLQRRGVTRDAEGLPIVAESTTVSLSIVELASRGLTDPENLKSKGWTLTASGITYRLDAAPIDYTAGLVTIVLKRSA